MFAWLVFMLLVVWYARDFGLPRKLALGIIGALLLLALLALVGVFGGGREVAIP